MATILPFVFAVALALFAYREFGRLQPVEGFGLLAFAVLMGGRWTVPSIVVAFILIGAAIYLRRKERRWRL